MPKKSSFEPLERLNPESLIAHERKNQRIVRDLIRLCKKHGVSISSNRETIQISGGLTVIGVNPERALVQIDRYQANKGTKVIKLC